MSRNLSIKWSKAPPREVAGKLEQYEVELKQNYGLLADKNKDYATVKTLFSYEVLRSNGLKEVQNRTRTVFGPPNEVYDYHLKHSNASREMFERAWQVAKDKNLDSLTVFPYKPAYINEKLSSEINKMYYGGAKEFAEKNNKDYSNIFKELKGTRKISLQQAIEYAKFLNCDPVDLLFEKLRTKVWASVDFINSIGTSTGYTYQEGQLKFFGEDKFTSVPRNIWRPDVRCVTVRSEGSYLDRLNLFYYKSKDKQPPNCHGKLCLIGVNVIFDGIADYQEYFVGIYEQGLGGKINLANPDPFAKNKYILTDIKNIHAVAPIVATVNPALLNERETREQVDNYSKLKDLILNEEKKQLEEHDKFVRRYKELSKKLGKEFFNYKENRLIDDKIGDLDVEYKYKNKRA